MTDFADAQRYIVAVTVATEVAPDSPDAEYRGVIDVMRNRAKTGRYGGNPAAKWPALVHVVLAHNQFSAVCREDYWRSAMAGEWAPQRLQRCFDLLGQDWPDTTGGALYYFSPISMHPAGTVPAWASGVRETFPTGARRGYFRFFKP